MFGKMKLKRLIWSVIFSLLILCSCGEGKNTNISSSRGITLFGETQGTTYKVIIAEENSEVTKEHLDSLFITFDKSLSNYIESSVISILNRSTDSVRIKDNSGYFKDCYVKSESIFNETNGCFDPSVFPLVKGWGFMNNMDTLLSQYEVDSVLMFVDFTPGKLYDIDFEIDDILFKKKHSRFMIDFNAIAQGQSVDVVDRFLSEEGHSNYYIEIGGEIIVRGKNREGINWRIGVDVPKDNLKERSVENILSISNKAVATSGSYRKFYIKNGIKYAHILNPKTGFPVQHSLLSATVIANDCATADGYATAFMVMGTEASLAFVHEHSDLNLDVYLLSSDTDGSIKRSMSDGFPKYIAE